MPSASQAASAGLAVGAVAVVVAFGAWTASNVSLVPAPAGSTSGVSVLGDRDTGGVSPAGDTGSNPQIADASTDPTRTAAEAGGRPRSAVDRSAIESGTTYDSGSRSSVSTSTTTSSSSSSGATGSGEATAGGAGAIVDAAVPPPSVPVDTSPVTPPDADPVTPAPEPISSGGDDTSDPQVAPPN